MSYPSTVEWQRYCHSLGLTKKLEEQPSEIRLPIKMTSTTNNELGRREKVGPVAISPSILELRDRRSTNAVKEPTDELQTPEKNKESAEKNLMTRLLEMVWKEEHLEAVDQLDSFDDFTSKEIG
ncbi:hypothetical protein V491_00554 [Pseudogymnoascus sp. VKM F-3775]|nr:hypothetical protein V491_00554 [Pseudogymnoascus sp. VKM F-3775]